MGMEENVSKEALAWYETHPKILEALQIIGRLHNDVSTFEVLLYLPFYKNNSFH